MKRYRIYTEDKNSFQITDAITRHGFHAATVLIDGRHTETPKVYEAIGLWNDTTEASLVIEIIDDESKTKAIRDLASDILHFNKQEGVLVTEEEVKVDLILA